MKIKRSALLASLACLTLIGSGAAVWTFGGGDIKTLSGTTVIADCETVGEVTVSGALTLTVDSGTALQFTSTAAATYSTTSTKTVEVSRTYHITYADIFKTYFTISNVDGTWTDGTAITAPTVSWIDGKDPTTKAAYEQMKSDLTDASITLTFIATTNNDNSIGG